MRISPRIFVFIILAALLFGCAGEDMLRYEPAPPPPDEAQVAVRLLASGEKAFAAGELDRASAIFTDFLGRYPGQPGADLAWLRHGQIQLAKDFPEGAKESLEQMIRAYPNSKHIKEARFLLAEVWLQLDQPLLSLKALSLLDRKSLPPPERTKYYELTARSRFKLSQPKAAVVALVRGYELAAEKDRPAFEDRLNTFVAAWPGQVLDQVVRLYDSAFPKAWIMEGQAKLAVKDNDWERALKIKKQMGELFPGYPPKRTRQAGPAEVPTEGAESEAIQTEELTEEDIQALPERVWTIGCLLPMSGPLADYGAKLLDGVQLAAEVFQPGSPFKLVIEDTGNDPLIAAQALEKLTVHEEAVAVVGPLSGRLAMAAAERAEELKIPLITLTQNQQVAATGGWVFRDFVNPDLLLEAMVERAVSVLGHKRIAILHPESAYGRRTADLFSRLAAGRGGLIVESIAYPPDKADLGELMVSLGGVEPGSPPREEPLGFEALFIPDDFNHVAQIAPQLAFYDVGPLTLLGTHLWYDQQLISLAGKYVQGAIIPSVFFPGSEEPAVKEFVARFEQIYERPPDLFAALGFDAVRLVVDIIKSRPIAGREEMRQSLQQTVQYPGVTGLTSFNQEGEAVKKPYLLTVRGGEFVLAPSGPPALTEQTPEPRSLD